MGFDRRLSIKETPKLLWLWIHEVTAPGSDTTTTTSCIRQSLLGTCLHLPQLLSSQLTNLPSSPQDLPNPNKNTPNQHAPILNATTASIPSPPPAPASKTTTSSFRISNLPAASSQDTQEEEWVKIRLPTLRHLPSRFLTTE